jgi:uncharacterized membrane protein YbhN (UPF0104 family)
MIRHSSVKVLIRLGFSLLLLALVTYNIDWQEIDNSGRDLTPGWLVVAILCVLASNGLAAVRWGWMMRQSGLPQTWSRFIGLYFAGGLINQGLPSTIGGDAYRGLQASRDHRIEGGSAVPYGFLVVLLDRGMGLLGNLSLGAVGLFLGGSLIAAWLTGAGLAFLAVVILFIVFTSWLLSKPEPLHWAHALLIKARLPHGLRMLRAVLVWPSIAFHWALSVLVHLLTMASFISCLLAYGVSAPIEGVMIGLSALGLLLILPVSMSGWGLREATLSSVLALWSIPLGLTVMASMTFGLTVALCHLPAALVLIRSRPAPVQYSD